MEKGRSRASKIAETTSSSKRSTASTRMPAVSGPRVASRSRAASVAFTVVRVERIAGEAREPGEAGAAAGQSYEDAPGRVRTQADRLDQGRHGRQRTGPHRRQDTAGRLLHGQREEHAVVRGGRADEAERGPRVRSGEDDEIRAPGCGERFVAELERDWDRADLPDDAAVRLGDPDRGRVRVRGRVARVLPEPVL